MFAVVSGHRCSACYKAGRPDDASVAAAAKWVSERLGRCDVLVNNAAAQTNTDMGRGGRPVRDGGASIMWAVHLPDDGSTGGFFLDARPLAW